MKGFRADAMLSGPIKALAEKNLSKDEAKEHINELMEKWVSEVEKEIFTIERDTKFIDAKILQGCILEFVDENN